MALAARLLKRTWLPMRRRGAALVRDERGVSAIEFGVLAIPFFAVIGAIFETSMVFFAGQVLDSAVNDAARKVRTGEAQAFLISDFRDEICEGTYNLFNCSNIKIRVTTIGNLSTGGFATVAANLDTAPLKPPPCVPATDATQCWDFTEVYVPGVADSIELVQVLYKWPIWIDFGGLNLDNQYDGARLLSVVRVFANEPFG